MKGHNILRSKINGITIKDVDIAKIIEDEQVVRNNVEARCSIIRGELPYNVLLGVPLRIEKDEADLTIMNIMNTTYGVREINKYSSKIVNKKYIANAVIITTSSNIINVEV